MGETQLIAELEGIRLEKERRDEELTIITKAVKDGIIHMLGLNIMPLEDPDTGLLRRPKDNEILPLVGYLANPELLKVVAERTELLEQQEAVEKELGEGAVGGQVKEMSPEELDDFINDDLLFVDDDAELEKHLAWNSPETKHLLDQIVKIREEPENSSQIKESDNSSVIIESGEVSAPPNDKEARVKIHDPE